jgi:hypothetical protein
MPAKCLIESRRRMALRLSALRSFIFALGVSMAQINKSDFFEKLATLGEKQGRLNIDHRIIKKD